MGVIKMKTAICPFKILFGTLQMWTFGKQSYCNASTTLTFCFDPHCACSSLVLRGLHQMLQFCERTGKETKLLVLLLLLLLAAVLEVAAVSVVTVVSIY